ncbi:MAG: hypothetical protein K0R57_408 [Paenibacillaceae bacterium]|jgi:hypothetical protein|nr:hypothetical protein [Paenibacillaceae bacterium]
MQVQPYSNKPLISGWTIFFFFIFFFPVAIILIFIRASKHTNLSYQKTIDMKVTGIWFTVVGVFFMLAGLGGSDSRFILISLFLGVWGIILISKASSKRKKLKKRYEHYLHLIHAQGIHSIEQLSNQTRYFLPVVMNDLLRMKHLGMLRDFTIDEDSNQLIPGPLNDFFFDSQEMSEPVSKGWQHPASQSAGFAAASSETRKIAPEAPAAKPQPRNVECPGCGAPMMIQPGKSRPCQYCGNILS